MKKQTAGAERFGIERLTFDFLFSNSLNTAYSI